MRAKLVKLMPFAMGIMPLLFLGGFLKAETPACSNASVPCPSPLGAKSSLDGGLRLAQAPAMTNIGPRVVIEQPKEDIPREAFKALEKHCARCHQAGRLERANPAKNFGNILQLDEIARDPHLIRPGNPDGSRLFSLIVKQEMPYDVYTEFSGGREPSKKDVQAIYDWIESLDAKTVASCDERKPVDSGQIVNAISTDLKKRAANRRKGMRYLTLTTYYNACAGDGEVGRMRNGAAMLLNSLSRAPGTTRTSAIGKAGSIIAFDLNDLGWSLEDWDTLVAAYPYGVRPRSQAFDQIKATTGTPLPYLRADWFAAAASRPPLYSKLLDLPEDLADLQNELGVVAGQNRVRGDVVRAGFEKSAVSWNNRVLERHAVGDGYLWMTFDFDGTDADQLIKARPLGPDGEEGFKHDMNAAIFSLPNGMNAYFLSDDEGKRIDAAPTEILHDEANPRQPVIAGLSCMSCHARGVLDAADEVRARVQSSSNISGAERARILQIYVSQIELDRRIKDDRNRYLNAAKTAGMRPGKKDDGLDDLTYLVRNYEKRLDIRVAAAEYGVTSKNYAAGMSKAGEEAQRTKQELEQGSMARRQFEPLFLKYAAAVSGDVPVGQVKAPDKRPAKPPLATVKTPPVPKKKVAAAPENPAKPEPPKTAKAPPAPVEKDEKKSGTKVAAVTPNEPAPVEGAITLVSDKARYRTNDLPVFTVNASSDCRLTLINVDTSGQAVVIFPNKYQQENFIKAEKDFKFPGPDAPFQFRLRDIGKEKLIAECAINSEGDRIQHDFERQEFTDLGDYRDHVGEQAENGSAGADRAALLRTAITFQVE